MSPEPDSIYVSQTRSKWVSPEPARLVQTLLFCGLLLILGAGVLLAGVPTGDADLKWMPQYCLAACCLCCSFVLGRMIAYALIGWTWYLLDYCVVLNCALVAFFWHSSSSSTPTASAIMIVATSTLPGFNMVLKGKLMLHHWEAFSSFWIHVAVAWLMYILRCGMEYRPELDVVSLLAMYSARVYCPWALMHLGLAVLRDTMHLPFHLSQQPYLLQDIVEQILGHPPTFFDKLTFMAGHGCIAHMCALIGCFAYHYVYVHMAWLLFGTAVSILHGAAFYLTCSAKLRASYQKPCKAHAVLDGGRGTPWSEAASPLRAMSQARLHESRSRTRISGLGLGLGLM